MLELGLCMIDSSEEGGGLASIMNTSRIHHTLP
jgi:hypothetical protein